MKSPISELLGAGLFFALVGGLVLGANVFAGQIVAPMDLLFGYAGWQEVGPVLGAHSVGRSDVVDGVLPRWIFLRESLIKGQLPLWDPMPAGGSPGFPFASVFSLGFLMFLFFGDGVGFTLGLWIHLLVAGLGAYSLCRTRLTMLPSIFGGITYMMCGFNSSWLMVSAVETSMWIPWVLWAMIRLEERPNAYRGAALAVFVSAMILGGFPAVAGYALYASILLGLWLLTTRIVDERKLWSAARRGILISFYWGLGMALSMILVVPFIYFIGQFDVAWRKYPGLPLRNAILLIFPFRDGPPWVENTGYVGVIAVTLAALAVVYALFRRRNYGPLSPRFWGFAAVITFVIIYETPASLARLIYQLPVFNNNFSGRMMVLFGLELAVLGAVGFEVLSGTLEKLGTRWPPLKWKYVKLVLLLCLVILQATDLSRVVSAQNTVVPIDTFYPVTPTIEYVSEHLKPGQYVISTAGAFGIAGSLGAYGIPEWFAHTYHTEQEKRILSQIVKNAWISPSAAYFPFDQVDIQSDLIDALANRYILTDVFSTRDYEQTLNDRPLPLSPQQPIGQVIQFSERYYLIGIECRLATYSRPTAGADVLVRFLDSSGSKIAESRVRGDDIGDNEWVRFRFGQALELPPGTYEFEICLGGQVSGPVAVWSLSNDEKFTNGYLVVKGKRAIGDLTFRLMAIPSRLMRGWTLVTPGDRIIVLERQSSPPGAYLLSENASWENPNPSSWSWKNVTLLEYGPNRQVFRVETDHSGWFVRAAQDWPGWVAYVNGEETGIRPYLGLLPAVHVQPGASTIEWRYEPWSVKLGAVVSIGALILLSLLCALPLMARRTRRGKSLHRQWCGSVLGSLQNGL